MAAQTYNAGNGNVWSISSEGDLFVHDPANGVGTRNNGATATFFLSQGEELYLDDSTTVAGPATGKTSPAYGMVVQGRVSYHASASFDLPAVTAEIRLGKQNRTVAALVTTPETDLETLAVWMAVDGAIQ